MAKYKFLHQKEKSKSKLQKKGIFKVLKVKTDLQILFFWTIFHISDHDKYAPKYSQGASSYSIRAPTGVDLALGLSGYDKLGKNLPPERIPTTLQSYKDSDMMRKNIG